MIYFQKHEIQELMKEWDFSKLNAKQEEQLLRIAVGKNGQKLLTKTQFEIAMKIWQLRQ